MLLMLSSGLGSNKYKFDTSLVGLGQEPYSRCSTGDACCTRTELVVGDCPARWPSCGESTPQVSTRSRPGPLPVYMAALFVDFHFVKLLPVARAVCRAHAHQAAPSGFAFTSGMPRFSHVVPACMVCCWSFTSLQHLTSYQIRHRLVTVHIQSNFIVLPLWENWLLAQ